MNTFKVLFYRDRQGKKVIEEFLNKCQTSQRQKVLRQIKYLQEFGITAINPNLRKLVNTPLWESRILGKDNIRLICGSINNQIVILHIFVKKSQNTPIKEIVIAIERFRELDN